MKNKALLVFLIFFCTVAVFSRGNPWGSLKKIYFYDSTQKYSKVAEELQAINFAEINRGDRKEIAQHLIKFGDYYFSKKKKDLAEAFYKKVVNLSPEYWYIYNKLEKSNRSKGNSFPDSNNIFRQLAMTFKDFRSAFLMLNGFINTFFFSGIFVFFIFSITLFTRYFRLAGNDLLIDDSGRLDLKKTIIMALALLWPVFILSGWLVYPFLITGFLWNYLSSNEKRTIKFVLGSIIFLSLVYSLNLSFERTIQGRGFKIMQQVQDGSLFDRNEYERFDDELKVLQAFNYYDNKQFDTALDILAATGENYRSVLKFDLLGNLNFKSGDIDQSIKYYKDSLNLDEKNEIALNNFALGLSRNENPEAFDSWAKRYPGINAYKDRALELLDVKEIPVILWKRLFNYPGEKYSLPLFLKKIFAEFFLLPVFYCILFFAAYIMLLKRFYANVGDSTYCSKCSRIIKKASIHKSYRYCDECHQLFFIKDVIFLEAKVLKEKELNRKFRKKYALILLLSLFIPGLNLNYRNKKWLFVFLTSAVYFLLGFAIVSMIVFDRVFAAVPMFFNFIAAAGVILYFLVNLFSVLGVEDGV
ncbi:MAG: hypothetical protein KAW12_00285 [Candidatus Aminicenantes bacterium]|nr:hypothetical protein [Candidatus Aminicenantes bacterium]